MWHSFLLARAKSFNLDFLDSLMPSYPDNSPSTPSLNSCSSKHHQSNMRMRHSYLSSWKSGQAVCKDRGSFSSRASRVSQSSKGHMSQFKNKRVSWHADSDNPPTRSSSSTTGAKASPVATASQSSFASSHRSLESISSRSPENRPVQIPQYNAFTSHLKLRKQMPQVNGKSVAVVLIFFHVITFWLRVWFFFSFAYVATNISKLWRCNGTAWKKDWENISV